MYGLLLENLSEYIKDAYDEDRWEEIRHLANIDQPAFSTHQVYPETLLPKLVKAAVQILGITEDQVYFHMGQYFVQFVGQYGYDRVLSVLGRHVRDFLNGLDNLHEYLKYSYPRMRPPSFFCEGESSTGMVLHYRSKRKGYAQYTMGQIIQVAKYFYDTDLKMEIVSEEFRFDTCHVTFQLTFDNKAFTNQINMDLIREEQTLPVRGHMLLEIFPFCIVFGNNLVVKFIGNSMMQIIPKLIGKKVTDWFDISKPLIEFSFVNILRRTNNIFELIAIDTTDKLGGDGNLALVMEESEDQRDRCLTLKGQMVYMEEWKMILFLATPVLPDLDSMIHTGLYINDLSMHDFSRDLMLAGTQKSVELKLALDQEQLKSKKLEESMKKLDEEMKRTDELLYQMIPRQVADRLRTGENPVDTCETFETVTILFSDVVTFTEICSRITPMEVVSMLNAMYSIFDNLTERHGVYKVETIGDAYMTVAGAPERNPNHGEMVSNMALDMVDAITDLEDPSTGNHLRIRVGVHSGMVVAGVVGLKMPRYCLFGDAVNTASRMESTSEAMRIHISETTAGSLGPKYNLEERGEITVKGKGTMKTFWLNEREGRPSIKGQFTDLSTSLVANRTAEELSERRGSTASRNYNPITFEDVARRSLTATPTPALGSSVGSNSAMNYINNNVGSQALSVPQMNEQPRIESAEAGRPRVQTFSNASFDLPTSIDRSPRPSITNTLAIPVISSQSNTPNAPPSLSSSPNAVPNIQPHELNAQTQGLSNGHKFNQSQQRSHDLAMVRNILHEKNMSTNQSSHLHPNVPRSDPRLINSDHQNPTKVAKDINNLDKQQQLQVEYNNHHHIQHHNNCQIQGHKEKFSVEQLDPSSKALLNSHRVKVDTVERGTSPVVTDSGCSGFTHKHRVHSHTCILL